MMQISMLRKLLTDLKKLILNNGGLFMTDENLAETYANQIISTKNTFEPLDKIYLVNQIYKLVGEDDMPTNVSPQSILNSVSSLVQVAIKNNFISDSTREKDELESEITNLYTPLPGKINKTFWNLFEESPKKATDYFYQINQQNNYIKRKRIAQNISYDTLTKYGNLEITINLSKPEKDLKDIEKAERKKQLNYPKCDLCLENEGHHGDLNHHDRTNHRVIRVLINGKEWGFQYSPYAYFEQHCIFLDKIHEPMKINSSTFANLLEIVSIFPDYFVGSNADLPIVGGSILTHEHYQGGKHNFPMMNANPLFNFTVPTYVDIKAEVLNWPMSTIRLTGDDKEKLINFATHILNKWKDYSDPSVDVIAGSMSEPHHTVTPIVQQNSSGKFEVYVVLRDNHTSKKYPDGVFHPHQEYQHIKQENIGLIEVMGRAILPPRLKLELKDVKNYLLDKPNNIKTYHIKWADMIKKNNDISENTADEVIKKELGIVFMHVLENAGVFKLTASGLNAFKKFIATL